MGAKKYFFGALYKNSADEDACRHRDAADAKVLGHAGADAGSWKDL